MSLTFWPTHGAQYIEFSGNTGIQAKSQNVKSSRESTLRSSCMQPMKLSWRVNIRLSRQLLQLSQYESHLSDDVTQLQRMIRRASIRHMTTAGQPQWPRSDQPIGNAIIWLIIARYPSIREHPYVKAGRTCKMKLKWNWNKTVLFQFHFSRSHMWNETEAKQLKQF